MTNFIKISIAVIVIMSAMSLSACNTMEGIGKDAAAAGKAIKNAADKARNTKGY